MCGIIGYIGDREATPILLEGLKRLEYRGYDSAGIALLQGREIKIRRVLGKLRNLESIASESPPPGSVGLGHTRWATHGKPTAENAHPHRAGGTVLVHNGIVENIDELRREVAGGKHPIVSETDTEIIAHLIEGEIDSGRNLEAAVLAATRRLEGSYAIAVIHIDYPDRIVGVKNGGSPIIVGRGEKESFLASDVPALLGHTRRLFPLEDGEMAVLTRTGVSVFDSEGNETERPPMELNWSPTMVEKGGYKHFMQKEIFEQPRVVADTLGWRVSERADPLVEGFDLGADELADFDRIGLLACGTSWHAALYGRLFIEEVCRIPVWADLASEFRYRDPLVGDRTLVLLISQSGETADTLAALREAKRRGATTVSLANVESASIPREADYAVTTHAGPEIGVAATKTYLAQLVSITLIALQIGRRTGRLDAEAVEAWIRQLLTLPKHIDEVLNRDAEVLRIARKFFHANDFLFLGRGYSYPAVLEGALKLKEISYIHAEACAAGEMKHGPIALIDEVMPVVILCPRGKTYKKVLANIEEVRARDGRVIVLATEKDEALTRLAEEVFLIPDLGEALTPVLCTVPLQLLAYHIAVLKGTDVDQPRNLAKSVTVE